MSKIIELLTTAPILSVPDFDFEFILETDASNSGLGAVLSQEFDGKIKVIAYVNKNLSEAERKYTTSEKECLAVVWAIWKYRPYLDGYRFRVITDHRALLWLHKLKNPTGRLDRWTLQLLEYNYKIEYRKEIRHVVQDALSRMNGPDNEYNLEEILLETRNEEIALRKMNSSGNNKTILGLHS